MKYYVFDVKAILSLTNKYRDKELKYLLFPFMAEAHISLSLFSAKPLTKDNYLTNTNSLNNGAFYLEELFFVFKDIKEEHLKNYLDTFNEFKEDLSKLDIVNRPDEYDAFFSNINRHLMCKLLIGSYKIVEDFDIKLEEAQSLGVINPIDYILARENDSDSIDPKIPYINQSISEFLTDIPEYQQLIKESEEINNTTNINLISTDSIFNSNISTLLDKDSI